MTIREIAKDFRDEIMDGIAWVAIWKVGRRWSAMAFWLDDDKIEEEDIEILQDILKMDENAVFINEYYCAHMGDGTLEDIVAGIRFHYENGYNLLRENEDYINATEGQEEKEAEDALSEVKDFMQTEAGEEPMLKFEYWIELKDGYRPTLQEEKETDVRIQLVAKNRATAQRMMAKLLEGAANVKEYGGVCVGEVTES